MDFKGPSVVFASWKEYLNNKLPLDRQLICGEIFVHADRIQYDNDGRFIDTKVWLSRSRFACQ